VRSGGERAAGESWATDFLLLQLLVLRARDDRADSNVMVGVRMGGTGRPHAGKMFVVIIIALLFRAVKFFIGAKGLV
jgi:hypothetical protein